MIIAKKTLVALGIFVLSYSNTTAQKITLVNKDHVFTNWQTLTTTSDRSHWFIVEGISGNQKAGYFGQHLKKYVQADSAAVRYVNSYARRQAFKLFTTVSTVTLFSVYAISNLSKESVSQENLDAPDKNQGLLYAAGGTFLVNVMLRAVHSKALQRAVDAYNQKTDKGGVGFKAFDITT